MRYNFAVMLLFAVSVSACAVFQPDAPVAFRTAYNADAHRHFTTTGTNTIEGQAYMRKKSGGTATCAGNGVLLLPNTPHFRELINIVRGGREPASPNTSAIDKSIHREAPCNPQGNFTFSNLPDASWLVLAEVKWTAGNEQQGATLMRQVAVSNGGVTKVLLTDGDVVAR